MASRGLKTSLLFGLLAALALGWFLLRRPGRVPEDRAVLSRPDAPVQQTYNALVRLGRSQDAAALKEALNRLDHPQAVVREAVAETLGFFAESDALAGLQKLLRDGQKSVRIRAIHALANRQDTSRVELIRKLLSEQLSPEESVAAHSALLRSPIDPEQRAQAISVLAKMGSEDSRSGEEAALRLVGIAPQEESVLEMLRVGLRRGSPARILPVAIRHLSVRRDRAVLPQLERYALHPQGAVRLAVIQSLRHACPEKRWSILERAILAEVDRPLRDAAIKESVQLGTQGAKRLLGRISADANSSEEVQSAVRQQLAALEGAAEQPDPCSSVRE